MFYEVCVSVSCRKQIYSIFYFCSEFVGKKIQEFRKLKQNFTDKNLNRRNNKHTSNLKDYTLNYDHYDDRYQQQGYYRSLR